jgi:hypothetical protein
VKRYNYHKFLGSWRTIVAKWVADIGSKPKYILHLNVSDGQFMWQPYPETVTEAKIRGRLPH